MLNPLWTSLILGAWTKHGKLMKDHRGETDPNEASDSFWREESDVVAPPKGKTGKEAAHVR